MTLVARTVLLVLLLPLLLLAVVAAGKRLEALVAWVACSHLHQNRTKPTAK
jgi:hypothetical protein